MEENKKFVTKLEFYIVVSSIFMIINLGLFGATLKHESSSNWVFSIQVICICLWSYFIFKAAKNKN